MKYWVFDLDGTLVDSLSIHFQTMEKVFRQFGLAFSSNDQQEILKLSANAVPAYIQEKFGIQNLSKVQSLYQELTTQSIRSISPFAGIEDLLSLLKSKEVRLAVWTARDLEATLQILESTNLRSHFSIVVSGSCVTQGKPHPEGLQKIAKYFGCSSDEMIMIGDFDSDMLGAKAFGCRGIRVTWHSSVEIKKCEIAHHQFDQVNQLVKWTEDQFNGQASGQKN